MTDIRIGFIRMGFAGKVSLEAAETVLGFDKSMYGDAPKKNKKWWQHINEEIEG